MAGNIDNGVRYLAEQYRRLGEIITARERLRFALAAYNGGRGYVNKALELAREAEGLPGPFAEWRRRGSAAGLWQLWQVAGGYLASGRCAVHGRTPDWRQMTDYVHRIEARYSQYLDAAGLDRRHPAWGPKGGN